MADSPRLICEGHVAQVGADVELLVKRADGTPLERSRTISAQGAFDHDEAMSLMFAWRGVHCGTLELAAVGHRVVHGGRKAPATQP